VCDGQQKIVDQAKAQGNAWDTGVVPGHRQMELNSTIAEEVKIRFCSGVMSEKRVDYGPNHRRKWISGSFDRKFEKTVLRLQHRIFMAEVRGSVLASSLNREALGRPARSVRESRPEVPGSSVS
jgi:hypothetical protein